MLLSKSQQQPPERVLIHAVLIVLLLGIFLAPLSLARAFPPQAQPSVQPLETGKFRLHKFQQAIGEESYEIAREGDALVMKTEFKFTDRGAPVPLSSTLRTQQDLTPLAFEIKGKTSRFSD